MATRPELINALRRTQAISDQYWHSLDRPLLQMSSGRTWTGPAADRFAGDLAHQRAELWRELRAVIDHLDKTITNLTVMGPRDE
ncbi:hypothetical protein [Nonomuraea glycinis]|uniref:hypothetical protein n=1 Tax=Nonomuraea glycinis TaxID=2047744 RepID=UPI0033B069C6